MKIEIPNKDFNGSTTFYTDDLLNEFQKGVIEFRDEMGNTPDVAIMNWITHRGIVITCKQYSYPGQKFEEPEDFLGVKLYINNILPDKKFIFGKKTNG